MTNSRFETIYKKIKESAIPLAALLCLFIFFTWMIIKPLAVPLIWSIVLSYFAYPLYRKLHVQLFDGNYANIAAAATTAAIVLFMAIPLLFVGLLVARESFRVYGMIVSSGLLAGSYAEIVRKLVAVPYLGTLVRNFNTLSGIPVIEAIINGSVAWLTSFLRVMSKQILGNAFRIFYLLAIVTISSFFFVRDGHLIINYIKEIIPLPGNEKEHAFERAATMLRSVVYGIIFTAGIQGTLGGLAWLYVGLPNPLFFGFCMFITGMIPFVGTPVIWIPGAIVLIVTDDITGGLLLLAWGFGVVSMIDNFIRPIFISEESHVHMLVIFIGIFGGLFNWGILGLFIGPLILSIGIFLLDIYRAAISDNEHSDLTIR